MPSAIRRASRRLARLVHVVGVDRNPLRRRTDRVRTVLALALAAFAAVTAVVAGFLGVHIYRAEQQAVRGAVGRLHPVSAVALDAAPSPDGAAGPGSVERPRVRVLWDDGGRSVHQAVAQVPSGTARGTRVTVWLDNRDQPAPIPPNPADLVAGAAGIASVGWLLACGLALGAHVGARRILMHRQLRAWEAEWRQIGPTWSGRTH